MFLEKIQETPLRGTQAFKFVSSVVRSYSKIALDDVPRERLEK